VKNVFRVPRGLGIVKSDARLFLGWFKPRGLPSIVFAIIVLDAKMPGGDILAVVVACTIILSILATASPRTL
jgi:NhaP-type Na+/H+ or K+/H+ antiporter